MGAKVKRKKNGVYYIQICHRGQRKQFTIGRSKQEATTAASRINAELVVKPDINLNPPEEAPPLTFNDAAQNWLDDHVVNLAASTAKRYEGIYTNHLKKTLARHRLDAINREDINNLMKQRRDAADLSNARIKRILSVVSGIYTHAANLGQISSADNPANGLWGLYPNTDHPDIPDPYTSQEIARFLETCERTEEDAYFAFFMLLARTGVRLGEALALRWTDIDFDLKYIHIRRNYTDCQFKESPKNGHRRIVSASDQLIDALKHHRVIQATQFDFFDRPELVFPSPQNKETPISGSNMQNRVNTRICKKANLRKIRLHDFRHTYATLRLLMGHRIEIVSKELGHSSLSVTQKIYFHYVPEIGAERRINDLDDTGGSGSNNTVNKIVKYRRR